MTNQLIKEFKRVTGKENLLFRVAEATVDAGDKLVRDTVYPVASQHGAAGSGGGVQVVGADVSADGEGHAARLVHQPLPGRADQAAERAGVPQQQHHSSAGARRAGADRPHASGNLRYYPVEETVSGASRRSTATGRELVYRPTSTADSAWCGWCTRCARFRRCGNSCGARKSGSVGADRWRNPAEDLPIDFEERRVEHYAALRKPLDPTEFIDELREEMRAELEALHAALPEMRLADHHRPRVRCDQADAAAGGAGTTEPAQAQEGGTAPVGVWCR